MGESAHCTFCRANVQASVPWYKTCNGCMRCQTLQLPMLFMRIWVSTRARMPRIATTHHTPPLLRILRRFAAATTATAAAAAAATTITTTTAVTAAALSWAWAHRRSFTGPTGLTSYAHRRWRRGWCTSRQRRALALRAAASRVPGAVCAAA
jgi:hypothetical protein